MTITPDELRIAAEIADKAAADAKRMADRAALVYFSYRLNAAADEIERLEEHLAAAELGLSILQKAKP